MSIGAAAEAMMRRRLLEEIYGRMSPDERRLFVRAAMQQQDTGDIIKALQKQGTQLDALTEHASRQSWLSDFGANIAGNAVFDGSVWLLRRLLRHL